MTTETQPNQTLVVDVDPSAESAHSIPQRIVAGYALQERIGAGGYGEVWRAIGPGGLAKAVKILHGNFDGPTADSELKSLELMRELRHPFLLNIERIETENNRVIVVTELAEGSLEDRFEELQRSGQKGIPRDQLLGFLRDAADALDFMHHQHGLQHLDIKPGNLLIQGGHVKVADFGLIKDIRQTNVSLIGGFTPLYAPPELFEGEPTQASDQYSLAIVYQIMLTGTPPFAGRTAAQLTAQHLSSKPDLAPLTPSDRSAMARALSKNPSARFPSCREFVDRLSTHRAVKTRKTSAVAAVPQPTRAAKLPAEVSRTQQIERNVESHPLPPLQLDRNSTASRPALFVGIGGLAGQILLQLRRKLSQTAPPAASGDAQAEPPLPAFALLYIDSDNRAVSSVGLSLHETLAIPLRDPNEYRSRSGDVLDWLSRRWLFNIPRSRQVEGLRPLGRLAFVDHHQHVREHLEKQLARATSPESIRATAEQLQTRLDGEKLDVFVVASSSGGTGGGAALDAGYLIRDILESAGIRNANIIGLLLHATSQKDQQARIHRANSLACLAEFHRFSVAHHGFPGAPACRLPASELPPFDNTYMVHLGDKLSDEGFETAVDNVANYLFHQAATPSRNFFNQIRAAENHPIDSLRAAPSLRTFGIAGQPDANRENRESDARELSRALLQKWGVDATVPRESRPAPLPAIADLNRETVQKVGLSVDQLVRQAMTLSEGDVGRHAANYFASHLKFDAGDPSRFTAIDAEFDKADPAGLPAEHPAPLLAAHRAQLAQAARKSAEQICLRILALADRSDVRLVVACQALSDFMHHLEQTLNALAAIIQDTDEERIRLAQPTHSQPTTPPAASGGKYITLSFCGALLRNLRGHVNEIRNAVRDFGAALMQSFTRITLESKSDSPHPDVAPLIDRFNRKLLADRSVSLRAILMQARTAADIPPCLKNAALAFLAETATSSGAENEQSIEDQAQPGFANVGGGRRLLAVLPPYLAAADWKSRLETSYGNCVTLDSHPDNAELFLCCEVEQARLDILMEQLAQGDPAITEMAARVHARIDIDW